ncbi:hypothetical protein [Paenibacillus xylanilyticus]|uniref:Lipoprotein n=1 Tax=Paenibacillus xylanilyticus TaxID=248903 RepID=A0A7Y6BV90_9BACL|nr:hypothetical protein [Paenibacillus xylanilyticus]NUU75198.1 hypothetical protein [Paenibacillus xylanilyticus]
MNRRIWFLAVITLILTVALTACDRHSTSEKKAATAKIEKHLAEKYEKEFAVETADDLFIHVPGELTGDAVGFETQAYPVDAPEETFKVEYWEEKGIIEDDYINHLMAGKLKSELSELISPILGRDIKIDAGYDNGAWGNMPDTKYTPATLTGDYDYSALVDVYVKQTKSIDKMAEAKNIDLIQRSLLQKGIEDVMIAFYYMSPDEFELIEQIRKEDEENNLYQICRASASCIVASGRVDEGEVVDGYNQILAEFDLYREAPYQPVK